MSLDRRHFLAATTATGAFSATEAIAAPTSAASGSVPISGLGVDAFHLGVRTASPDDQTEVLQRAIDRAAGARLPLILTPVVYRARGLVRSPAAPPIGVPGPARLLAVPHP